MCVFPHRILDTALLYPHPSGPPAKCALRVLCSKYLRRTIQQGSHDSAVDARAALDLVRLKVQHGKCVCVCVRMCICCMYRCACMAHAQGMLATTGKCGERASLSLMCIR